MVAVKTNDKVKDMEKDGLDLYIDDGYVKADRTFCKFTQIITYLLHITRTMWNCTYLFKIFKDSLWL